jgi:hypothetical protein
MMGEMTGKTTQPDEVIPAETANIHTVHISI